MMLTNTPGVLDKAGKLLTDLTAREIDELFADGTISGGMLPKIAVGARRREERRQHGAHHRRPRAARDAARSADRAGLRHDDPLALTQRDGAACPGRSELDRHASGDRRPRRGRRSGCSTSTTRCTTQPCGVRRINAAMTDYVVTHLGTTTTRRGAAPALLAALRRDAARPGAPPRRPGRPLPRRNASPAGPRGAAARQRARPRRAARGCRGRKFIADQRAARLRAARARHARPRAPLRRRDHDRGHDDVRPAAAEARRAHAAPRSRRA